MTNNLTLTSDWTPFLAEDRVSTKFDKFLNVVKNALVKAFRIMLQ